MLKKLMIIGIIIVAGLTNFVYAVTQAKSKVPFRVRIQSEQWYENGMIMVEKGRLKQAVECFEKALEINPGNYKAKEKLEEVIDMALKAIKPSPYKAKPARHKKSVKYIREESRARRFMNRALTKRMLKDIKIRSRFSLVSKYLKGPKKLNPENIEIESSVKKSKVKYLKEQALNLAENGKFDKAINLYKEALKLAPYDTEIHIKLGLAYAYNDRLYEAIKEFQTVVKIADPDSQQKEIKIAKSMIEKLRSFI